MSCARCAADLSDCQRLCAPCFRATFGPPIDPEPRESIEQQLARITATRKARERVTGRKYTITDAWAQRPGVSAFERGSGAGFR